MTDLLQPSNHIQFVDNKAASDDKADGDKESEAPKMQDTTNNIFHTELKHSGTIISPSPAKTDPRMNILVPFSYGSLLSKLFPSGSLL